MNKICVPATRCLTETQGRDGVFWIMVSTVAWPMHLSRVSWRMGVCILMGHEAEGEMPVSCWFSLPASILGLQEAQGRAHAPHLHVWSFRLI